MAVSLTLVFVPMSGVVVVVVTIVVIGDIPKLATETLHFSPGYVLVDLILSGNLRNTIT